MSHPLQRAADIALGAGGVTSPVWLQYLETGSKTVAVVGGAALVIVRLGIAIRDWRNGNKG